jgi:tetraacyldisaccharide 4'-kinase
MSNIFKKIESIMNSKRKADLISIESFLFALSLIYGRAVKTRAFLYNKGILLSKKLPCAVISIGNITVGGTGKTPMTIYVAKLLKGIGYRVVVISRGYKGSEEKTGGIVSDGKTIFMNAYESGDEPYMIAKKLHNIPVVIGRNRFNAGITALKNFHPDVMVLDDAYQHLHLKRDINIVLLDSICPFGNKNLLPRGTLRESPTSLKRSDVVIQTRSEAAEVNEDKIYSVIKSYAGDKPIFKAMHIPYIYKVLKKGELSSQTIEERSTKHSIELLQGRKAFIFSGIARNIDFYNTVIKYNCQVTGFLEFTDHHHYSDKDINNILLSAKESNADYIVTTEKDYARIVTKIKWPIDLVVIGIKISFGNNGNEFNLFIKNRLKKYTTVHGLKLET